MRITSTVTSISWVPSEAVRGMTTKLPFESGIAHYDEPPPDTFDDLEALRAADRFRFANDLRAWIDVADGRIVDCGYAGSGHIGSTTLRVGGRQATFQAVALPDLQREPELSSDGQSARFVQTCGGRTGVPAPRRVRRKPFLQIAAPLAWTTLSLTLRADGTSEFALEGASPFPRHWIYDEKGNLAAKSGLIDFKEWYRQAFGRHTPWGDEESPALVTQVESAMERDLALTIMRQGAKPKVRKVAKGKVLMEQGTPGDELYLLLDGVLRFDVDDEPVAELGPGAVIGERAILEGGIRTATARAVTDCRVAVAAAGDIDRDALVEISKGHRREHEAH
jgi:hypothetical protein